MRLTDITDKLQLRNFTQTTQRLDYVRPDGTVDTIEVYPGQRATVPTENLSTTPSPAAFYYEGAVNLDNPELRTALGLKGGAPAEPPPVFTALTLSNYNVAENTASGQAIANILGGLSGSVFSLLENGGGRVALNGAKTGLVTGLVNIDYETTPFVALTLRETLRGYSNDTALNLIVTDVFEPTPLVLKVLALSNTSLAENTPISTALGTLSNVSGGTLSIVAGGSSFSLTGTTVYPKVAFDYESGVVNYSLTVRESDPNFPSNTRDTSFVITVTNVLEIVLNSLGPVTFGFVENLAAGATVATLTGRRTDSTLTLDATDKVTLDASTGVLRRGTGTVTAGTPFTFSITESFPDAAPLTTTFTVTPTSPLVDYTVADAVGLVSPVAQDAVVSTITETGATSRPASIGTLNLTVPDTTATNAVLVTLD